MYDDDINVERQEVKGGAYPGIVVSSTIWFNFLSVIISKGKVCLFIKRVAGF